MQPKPHPRKIGGQHKLPRLVLGKADLDIGLPRARDAARWQADVEFIGELFRQFDHARNAAVAARALAQGQTPGAADRHPADAGIKAYLELFYQGGRCENYVERMRSFSEVRRCSGISGETDMLVYIEAASMQRFSEIRGEIENYPGMQKVKTHMVVKDWAF